MNELQTGAREDVLSFYKNLQFNVNESPEIAAELIKKKNNVQYIYPSVEDFYLADNILEMGCGAGWLSNSIAYYYGLDVTAIDFNPNAVEAAKKTSEALDIDVNFQCADLFKYRCEPKDIVISVGVLHHTSDVGGGILRCIDLTKTGGKVFIGLYHAYGRKPFLDYFEQLKSVNSDEDFLFRKYRELDHRHGDNVQSRSWFLDQVLHPYESQHTLQEIVKIFQQAGVRLVSTSINNYNKDFRLDELYEAEKKLYDVGMQYLRKQEYFPGFFYVLGQKE